MISESINMYLVIVDDLHLFDGPVLGEHLTEVSFSRVEAEPKYTYHTALLGVVLVRGSVCVCVSVCPYFYITS